MPSQRPSSEGGYNLKRLAWLQAGWRYMTNQRVICLVLPQAAEVHFHVRELVKINTQPASFVSPAEAVHSHADDFRHKAVMPLGYPRKLVPIIHGSHEKVPG